MSATTTDATRALGERALACGTRWVPGMRDLESAHIYVGAAGRGVNWWALDGSVVDCSDDGELPDLGHPGTQGCILAQAAERWAEDLRGDALVPALAIERVTGGWRWRLTGWASFNGSDLLHYNLRTVREMVAVAQNGPTVPTYGEACVSALEGSP